MKLSPPITPKIITQPFGANASTYYAEDGLRGHTGQDIQASFGQLVVSACDSYAYSLMNKDNPDPMKYRAIFTIFDDGVDCYEISYGHAKDILVKEGDILHVGTPVITAGNSGDVASGGRKITREEKLAGSTAGTHLHFQVRKLVKVTTYSKYDYILTNSNGVFKKDGVYFKVPNPADGFAGCQDPEQFFQHVFYKTLKSGMKDPEVLFLRKKLGLTRGDSFGPITKAAVKIFQKANRLNVDGVVGPETNKCLNN